VRLKIAKYRGNNENFLGMLIAGKFESWVPN